MFFYGSPCGRPNHSSGNTKDKSLTHWTIFVTEGKGINHWTILVAEGLSINHWTILVTEGKSINQPNVDQALHHSMDILSFKCMDHATNQKYSLIPKGVPFHDGTFASYHEHQHPPCKSPVHRVSPIIPFQPKAAFRHKQVRHLVPENRKIFKPATWLTFCG